MVLASIDFGVILCVRICHKVFSMNQGAGFENHIVSSTIWINTGVKHHTGLTNKHQATNSFLTLWIVLIPFSLAHHGWHSLIQKVDDLSIFFPLFVMGLGETCCSSKFTSFLHILLSAWVPSEWDVVTFQLGTGIKGCKHYRGKDGRFSIIAQECHLFLLHVEIDAGVSKFFHSFKSLKGISAQSR